MADDRIHLSSGTEDVALRPPWESLFFAYAAMAPIALGAAAFFWGHGHVAALAMRLTIMWSGAIVCFLSGVRRGLSFRQEGGPLLTQVASMLWLFALGLLSLVVFSDQVSLVLLIIGFATIAIYDPIAARQAAAPRYFMALRPLQMSIPIVSLLLILAGSVWRP